jgi:hypothetical protein
VGVQGSGENALPGKSGRIAIHESVSSLIFLHACAAPSSNQKAYFNIFNTFDSADLLGWYEITYEDGFVITVPIQYGVNILECNPGGEKSLRSRPAETSSQPQVYCYTGDSVPCSSSEQEDSLTFYAFEWTNPRLGKKIRDVRLKGSVNYEGLLPVFERVVTERIPCNAIILIALSKAIKRNADSGIAQ